MVKEIEIEKRCYPWPYETLRNIQEEWRKGEEKTDKELFELEQKAKDIFRKETIFTAKNFKVPPECFIIEQSKMNYMVFPNQKEYLPFTSSLSFEEQKRLSLIDISNRKRIENYKNKLRIEKNLKRNQSSLQYYFKDASGYEEDLLNFESLSLHQKKILKSVGKNEEDPNFPLCQFENCKNLKIKHSLCSQHLSSLFLIFSQLKENNQLELNSNVHLFISEIKLYNQTFAKFSQSNQKKPQKKPKKKYKVDFDLTNPHYLLQRTPPPNSDSENISTTKKTNNINTTTKKKIYTRTLNTKATSKTDTTLMTNTTPIPTNKITSNPTTNTSQSTDITSNTNTTPIPTTDITSNQTTIQDDQSIQFTQKYDLQNIETQIVENNIFANDNNETQIENVDYINITEKNDLDENMTQIDEIIEEKRNNKDTEENKNVFENGSEEKENK